MRGGRLGVVLLIPTLAFCHQVAPPKPPAPPPAPPPVATSFPQREAGALIPRKIVLGEPDRGNVQISPDGKSIGWLAPADGVLNVFVAPSDEVGKAKAVTHQRRSIRRWRWSFTKDLLVFFQDRAGDKGDQAKGDESEHLFTVDLAKGETKDITPIDGADVRFVHMSSKRPAEMLVTINSRDHKFPDPYTVDLTTGVRKQVLKNDFGFSTFLGDDDLRVRVGLRHAPDGGTEIAIPPQGKDEGKTVARIPFEDALSSRPIAFDKTGDVLFLTESMARKTSAVFALDMKSGSAKLVAEDPSHADVGHVLFSPVEKTVQAVSFEYDKLTWNVVDSAVEGDFYYLQNFGGDGRLDVTSRSLDEQHWVVSFSTSDGPTLYYRYDRDPDVPGTPGKASFLFRSSEALDRAKLSAMKPVVIKARDGTDLLIHLTMPPGTDPRDEGRPKYPLPTVVLVHDGPWERAPADVNPLHRWLADRGYAVLSVDFRGSRGLGTALLNGGNQEWGGKMQDDLAAAAKWAVDEKIAQVGHVAVMGEGYGGYAVLEGMADSPFACGVDLGGPPKLVMYLVGAPPFAEPQGAELARRVGDYRSDDGKKFLGDRSPASHPERIGKPLLIGQGKNDPRVAWTDTLELAQAVKSHHIAVTYAVYPDEARGLSRVQNVMSFAAVAEAFLGQCLGGASQPFGNELGDSSVTVPLGAENVPGLREALGPERTGPIAPPEPAPSASPAPSGSAPSASPATSNAADGGALSSVDGGPATAASKGEADAGARNQRGDGGK
jgi:dipeptidyl aminopeptidase/acylaminoacyl peptidase